MIAYLDWKVGDRVVCVDSCAGSPKFWDHGEAPESGTVYTLRSIYVLNDEPVVQLEEISRSDWSRFIHGPCVGYRANRFRKVVARKTSIAIFERLLNPSDADTFRELEAEEFDYSDVVPFR